jgi:MoaA/NifB/PqqE/SkfB family radical SAM enzyme
MDKEKYKFGGSLTSEFPSQLIIDITEVCNLACTHCPHPQFKVSEHYGKRYLEAELNKKMVDEVAGDGKGYCQYIRYTSNGEPLIHPRGYELIAYAVENSGTFVCLTTNGTIMKEKKTRQLLDSGVHMIDISLDAHTPETYSKIRVGGDLNVTRENVLRLIKWVKETGADTKVVVSFVEQPQNTHEAKAFETYWKEQGASSVVIRRLHSAAGAVKDIAKAMRKKQTNERYPCLYPWERLVVDPKGLLAFCPADWTYSSPAGDLRTSTVKEIWQGEFMQKLRKAHLTNNFSCHGFCGQCPDWSQTRWPGQGGRRYADLVQDMRDGVNYT